MTDLLKQKAEEGELDECGTEQLEVIDKIKYDFKYFNIEIWYLAYIPLLRGPLWMMVNITIFGDAATMGEMIDALE